MDNKMQIHPLDDLRRCLRDIEQSHSEVISKMQRYYSLIQTADSIMKRNLDKYELLIKRLEKEESENTLQLKEKEEITR